jgi:hypothetical protein
MSQEQFERIEARLQQAQQERAEIQEKLSQVLSLVEPLKRLQLFDPSEFQSQLREIQVQLLQAQQERSHLQSQVTELPSRLSPDLATQLYQLLSSQLLSDIQTQLQQVQQEQKHLQSLLSELPLQVSQLVKTELENIQSQTAAPPPVPEDSSSDPWSSTTSTQAPSPPISATTSTARLQELLAAGRWKDADYETKSIMLKVSGLGQEGKLNKEHLENFPCENLRTIDQLWMQYSNDRFGFSVQKRLFESVGGKPGVDDYKIYCRFGESVGWLVRNCWLSESDLMLTLDAPYGHLPVAPFLSLIRGIRSRKLYFGDFFLRIETCGM